MAGKWTWQSRSARVSSRMACFMCRRPRASWPTRTPKKNGSKQKPRRAPCCGRPNRCSSAWTNPFNTRQHRPKENRMLLMLDNYDSFTYNLVQYFGELGRSEENTSELQSLMRISYAVFFLKKKQKPIHTNT